ncbi:membrane cofactor protein-like [Poeciliopsis prolifica]|uniref:membrane cofactor protein-like n=1 Tax=Poeciliopsis prolifica TaxID=188132 RepID=UPI00072CD6A6|nr:membrane cofactor protein-like [Poeciliopsis prolifica]
MNAKKGFFVIGLLYWNLIMSVSALFLLSSLCLAITAHGQQCSKPAGRQNMHLKKEYILKDTFEDGSTVAFDCDAGYTPARGSGSINCSSGIWTPVLLTCERKNCGSLDEVTNGQVSYPQGVQFGDKALITCNIGHILVGKSEITCGIQGWMDRLPTCEVVKCLQPSGIAKGTFKPVKEDYAYREVVEYSCNNGYVLNGSTQIICEKNEKFEPSPPSCIWVECKDPMIPNAERIDGSPPPYRHKASVIYNCKHGYRMIGQGSLTCNISSQWFPRIPECISSGNVVMGGLLSGFVTITVMLVQNYWM